jgi:hypothetical protein
LSGRAAYKRRSENFARLPRRSVGASRPAGGEREGIPPGRSALLRREELRPDRQPRRAAAARLLLLRRLPPPRAFPDRSSERRTTSCGSGMATSPASSPPGGSTVSSATASTSTASSKASGTRSRTRCRANSADWPPACGRSTSPAPRSQSHADGVRLGQSARRPSASGDCRKRHFCFIHQEIGILAHCFMKRPVDNSAADEDDSRAQRTRAAASTART